MDWKSIMKNISFYLLRIFIVLLLILIAVSVGAMIGYSIIGDGDNPMDIFNPQLWQYILDFIFN